MSQGPAEPAAAPAPGERRQGDRRRSDRRGAGGRRFDDSGADAGVSSLLPGADSLFDPGWQAAGDAAGRASAGHGASAGAVQDHALARVVRTYVAARAAIGLGLVGVQAASSLLGAGGTEWVALVCVAYAVQAISYWLLPGMRQARGMPTADARRSVRPWLATLGVDLLCFGVLHVLALGVSFNYGALLALPVLMAGVLTARLLALATAAGVALGLLAVAWISGSLGGNAPALLLQAGLAGLGLFVIALLAGELAGRLAREEQAARGSLELARQQARLNRLVIEEMADGVLVVDRRARVRAANPAARALLVDQGLSPPAPFRLSQRPAWAALLEAVQGAFAQGHWPDAGRELAIAFGRGHVRILRMRVRFVRAQALDRLMLQGEPGEEEPAPGPGAKSEPLLVALLEDVRTAQARIQQEKLAAMGRVSAGVAHEIRNPLAAIAQANALLLEDPLTPAQQRLARIISDNVLRLKRLVDDVMEIAPSRAAEAVACDASAVVAQCVTEWSAAARVPQGAEARLRCELPAQPLAVAFDPEHLRRVLVNLLDNAVRHASAAPGSVFLRMAPRDDQRVALSVLSDSPPIPPEVERHLFEPFFSTRSRGSGLGLYICRELCERYGASIEYRPRPAAERLRNEFLVTLQRCALPQAAGVLP